MREEKITSHKVLPYEMLYEAVSTTKKLVEGGLAENELLVLKSFLKNLKTAIGNHIEAAENGSPVVGTHFAYPMEIYCSFDTVPIVFEVVNYTLAALLPEGIEKFYDISDSWGHPYHTCSSQKGILGMTIDQLFDFDVLASPTAPCDNSIGSYPAIKTFNEKWTKKDIPLLLADMPVTRDDRSYEYYGRELLRFRDNLSKIIGQEPDDGRLRKAVDNNNKCLEVISEINELKKLKPCPVESLLNPCMTGVMAYLGGQPERLDFCKNVLEIAKKRAKKGERAHPGEEKFRAVCPNMSIFFDLAICEWFDREMGMPILFDIFTYLFYDKIDVSQSTEEIYEGLARQSMEFPMVRQSYNVDSLMNDFIYLTKEYDADCAVFTSHLGCKQFHSLVQLLREALRDEVGIPMLTIELDVGDARFTSIQTIKREVENFVQTLM
ncbi:MAG: 2-hydroxyacyl-CoA dehydratase [Promethearchaeota archaeon]